MRTVEVNNHITNRWFGFVMSYEHESAYINAVIMIPALCVVDPTYPNHTKGSTH